MSSVFMSNHHACLLSQDMGSAVITYCGHFFHGNCLRKWLYVQETCPMCHQAIRPTLPGQGGAPSADPDLPVRDEHPNGDGEVPQETGDTPAMPDPTELQEGTETRCGTNHQPVEPRGGDHHHIGPGGDPAWSCTSGSTGQKEPQSVNGESGSWAEAPERVEGDSKSLDSGGASLPNSQTGGRSWTENSHNDATQPYSG